MRARLLPFFLFSGLFASLAATGAPSSGSGLRLQQDEAEPRVWQCDFPSRALGRAGRFLVILPAGAAKPSASPLPEGTPRLPAIYLLHGRGRNERSLLDPPSTRERLLASPCAIILPRGDDGWYVNSPVRPADRYADYLDEIIALAERHFPVSKDPRHRAVGGWSMGGYGAAMTVVRRPADFRALATIIGLLDFPRRPVADPRSNYTVPVDRFGNDDAVWATLNPRLHVDRLRHTALLLVIGEAAFDRQMNEAFIATATAAGNPPRVVRLPGGHSFATVEQGLPPVLNFLETQVR